MLNWADLVLIAIMALSAAFGLWRGLIVEVLSLLIWIAAFWLAFQFGEPASTLFEGRIDAPSARLFLAYGLLFLSALLLGGLLTWLVRRLIQATGLSGTDRLFGLVFGLVRGGALISVLVLLLGFTPMPRDHWWRESLLLPTFERNAEWLRSKLPENVSEYIRFDPEPSVLEV